MTGRSTDGDTTGGTGIVIAIVVGLIVIAAAVWLLFFRGSGEAPSDATGLVVLAPAPLA